MKLNEISGEIIDSAMKVHSELGPGLLEKVYTACLHQELLNRGIRSLKEVAMPVLYCGTQIDIGYRIDLLVEDFVIVEVKATSSIIPIHKSQLFTYLKLSKKPLGLLLNFGEQHLRNGIVRIKN
jgi:GxxExxY protein